MLKPILGLMPSVEEPKVQVVFLHGASIQREDDIHRPGSLHIPPLLPDSSLRRTALQRRGPTLLDACDSGLEQRHFDGVGHLSSDNLKHGHGSAGKREDHRL